MKISQLLLALASIPMTLCLPQALQAAAPEFPGSLFMDLDASEPRPITMDSPAAVHAPVFLFARTGPTVVSVLRFRKMPCSSRKTTKFASGPVLSRTSYQCCRDRYESGNTCASLVESWSKLQKSRRISWWCVKVG